jgi:hypothetical protein
MTVSTGFLAVVVTVAVIATAIAPIVLLYLWIKDIRRGELW